MYIYSFITTFQKQSKFESQFILVLALFKMVMGTDFRIWNFGEPLFDIGGNYY